MSRIVWRKVTPYLVGPAESSGGGVDEDIGHSGDILDILLTVFELFSVAKGCVRQTGRVGILFKPTD